MISLDEILLRRRSIRKFKQDSPPEEMIASMVFCGSRAPSPSHSQPVRFIRLSSATAKGKLYDAMREGRQRLLNGFAVNCEAKKLHNYVNAYFRFSEFMFEAPVLMCVAIDTAAMRDMKGCVEIDDPARKRRDLDITVGLAVKGYLLKGEELGLRSCILTAPLMYESHPENVLGIESVDIRCFIASGWPDEEPAHLERKSLAEIYRVL